jgi:hypothetical protein
MHDDLARPSVAALGRRIVETLAHVQAGDAGRMERGPRAARTSSKVRGLAVRLASAVLRRLD